MGQPGNKLRNLKAHGNKWKWNHIGPKFLGYSKSSSKREVYSNAHLPQEEKSQINNLTLHPKELEKEQQNLKPAEGKNND